MSKLYRLNTLLQGSVGEDIIVTYESHRIIITSKQELFFYAIREDDGKFFLFELKDGVVEVKPYLIREKRGDMAVEVCLLMDCWRLKLMAPKVNDNITMRVGITPLSAMVDFGPFIVYPRKDGSFHFTFSGLRSFVAPNLPEALRLIKYYHEGE